jgi:hypothetical protein
MCGRSTKQVHLLASIDYHLLDVRSVIYTNESLLSAHIEWKLFAYLEPRTIFSMKLRQGQGQGQDGPMKARHWERVFNLKGLENLAGHFDIHSGARLIDDHPGIGGMGRIATEDERHVTCRTQARLGFLRFKSRGRWSPRCWHV